MPGISEEDCPMLNRIVAAEVSNLRDKAANWIQQAMSKEQKLVQKVKRKKYKVKS